ncbi:Tfp pilus assembly protein FimT/FimU [Candidatus Riflebacteria bacterium]
MQKAIQKAGVSLIELIMIVTIIIFLLNVAKPYYFGYIRESQIVKATDDLDLMARTLMAARTEGEHRFITNSVPAIFAQRMTNIKKDPWGRNYEINTLCGYLFSRGEDVESEYDDIVVYYEPVLALTHAYLLDRNNDYFPTKGEKLVLNFSKLLKGQVPSINTSMPYLSNDPSAQVGDLLFSPDVLHPASFTHSWIATGTKYVLTVPYDRAITLGVTTIGIKSSNRKFTDCEGIPALGTSYDPRDEQKLQIHIRIY